jgi:hypothetical protein
LAESGQTAASWVAVIESGRDGRRLVFDMGMLAGDLTTRSEPRIAPQTVRDLD